MKNIRVPESYVLKALGRGHVEMFEKYYEYAELDLKESRSLVLKAAILGKSQKWIDLMSPGVEIDYSYQSVSAEAGNLQFFLLAIEKNICNPKQLIKKAVQGGCMDIVERIVSFSSNLKKKQKRILREGFLSAVWHGNFEMVKYFYSAGAKPKFESIREETPTEILEFLTSLKEFDMNKCSYNHCSVEFFRQFFQKEGFNYTKVLEELLFYTKNPECVKIILKEKDVKIEYPHLLMGLEFHDPEIFLLMSRKKEGFDIISYLSDCMKRKPKDEISKCILEESMKVLREDSSRKEIVMEFICNIRKPNYSVIRYAAGCFQEISEM